MNVTLKQRRSHVESAVSVGPSPDSGGNLSSLPPLGGEPGVLSPPLPLWPPDPTFFPPCLHPFLSLSSASFSSERTRPREALLKNVLLIVVLMSPVVELNACNYLILEYKFKPWSLIQGRGE